MYSLCSSPIYPLDFASKKNHLKIISYTEPGDPWHKRALIRSLERITGQRKLQKLYDDVMATHPTSQQIWSLMLEKLDIDLEVANKEAIPKDGPVIIIANHPFGVVDGIILGKLFSDVRMDFKVLVNSVLCRNEVLNQHFLPVSFDETKEAIRTNLETRKIALDNLQSGGSVGIFPGGGVATAPRIGQPATDLEWKRFVVKLIKKSNAQIIPVFFYGQNSQLFQVASHISLNLRLGVLLNEVNNKKGKTLKITVGRPISAESLSNIKESDAVLAHLRGEVYRLRR